MKRKTAFYLKVGSAVDVSDPRHLRKGVPSAVNCAHEGEWHADGRLRRRLHRRLPLRLLRLRLLRQLESGLCVW